MAGITEAMQHYSRTEVRLSNTAQSTNKHKCGLDCAAQLFASRSHVLTGQKKVAEEGPPNPEETGPGLVRF